MTYSKPEVAVLGDAARLIQMNEKRSTQKEPPLLVKPIINPAYDPDE